MDRFSLLYSGKDNEQEEVRSLKKQLREEKARFIKQKAVLEQEVELLTIQLHEASEREKLLKKNYESMIKALHDKRNSIIEKERDFSAIKS
jgi:hypothetical protein